MNLQPYSTATEARLKAEKAALALLHALRKMLNRDEVLARHFGHRWPADLDNINGQARQAIAQAEGGTDAAR